MSYFEILQKRFSISEEKQWYMMFRTFVLFFKFLVRHCTLSTCALVRCCCCWTNLNYILSSIQLFNNEKLLLKKRIFMAIWNQIRTKINSVYALINSFNWLFWKGSFDLIFQMRSSMIACDNGKAHTLDILYATTNLVSIFHFFYWLTVFI